MKSVSAYLFAIPQDGQYLVAVPILAGLLLLAGLLAGFPVNRGRFNAVRRRARKFRAIAVLSAILLGFYALARYADIPALEWRVWLYLILLLTVVRLAVWGLSLRSLQLDKVEEQQTRRRQSYFKRSGKRRPAKRKRRR